MLAVSSQEARAPLRLDREQPRLGEGGGEEQYPLSRANMGKDRGAVLCLVLVTTVSFL